MAGKKGNISITEQSGVVVSNRKKKKGGGTGLVLFLLFVILLVAAVAVAFVFDLFSFRQSVVNFAMGLDRGYVQETLQTAEEEKAKAQEAQTLADSAKSQYEKKLGELDEREKAVAQGEVSVGSNPKSGAKNSQTAVEKRTAMIGMFENMDRTIAAQTLQNIGDVGTVAGILSEMKKKAAAEIMDKFPADYAAAVAKAML